MTNQPLKRTGLARALSKLGFCSRSHAWEMIRSGQVKVNGILRLDPEWPVHIGRDHLEARGKPVMRSRPVYLMLNKPRGLVTSSSDERGRETVFSCFAGHAQLPFLSPVGRLDKASEGLLLFTNDTQWAARLIDPASHVVKTYHVQIDCVIDEALLQRIQQGVPSQGELLRARSVSRLRTGQKNSWLEIKLDEGRNRHIRRMLAAVGVNVVRLLRVAVGGLELGNLPKGSYRQLTPGEVRQVTTNC